MKAPDPTNLRRHERPALVDVSGQGPVFVADASTKDNGWLRVKEWNGTSAKLPPHRVRAVRYLETEYYGNARDDGSKPKRLAAERWRAEAAEIIEEIQGDDPTDAIEEQGVTVDV